ncbi:MAG: hypothetical protein GXO79_15895 [Chlorobi bacterium]|nr:hypothetical protein [Chlorobiota bacterium]
MKQIILTGFLVSSMLFISCHNQYKNKSKQYLINMLEKAENLKNTEQIKSIYLDSAVLYTKELMPVKGIKPIISIYKFMFSKQNIENVKYITDSISEFKNKHFEFGINIMKRAGQPADTNKFKAVFVQKENKYKISEIYFGEEELIKRKLPVLPKPTGKYKVGQTSYFYDRTLSGNNRLLSFQVWYPAIPELKTKAVYQSEEMVEASSDFLGFPLFMVSYFSLIKSNSFLNATVFPDKKFPVLLYNHGYGGFTSVYQTVFEELASHGYIVVSIGHENESALLLANQGKVIANNPENEFYKSRSNELNGIEISELQRVILNSDDVKENRKAYQKLIELSPLHNESTRLWQSDTKAVYAKLIELNKKDNHLKGAFDFNLVGAFGHSVGGATAGQLAFSCNATKAAINLDGFQFGDLVNNNLQVPFMFVSSSQQEGRYLRASTFIDNSETDCYQVVVKGFTHSSFTDLEYFLRGNPKIIELQRALILSFFDKYLKGKDVKLSALEKEFPEIRILINS